MMVRWLVNLAGALAGLSAAVRGGLEAWAMHARSLTALDSPEYASEISWRTVWNPPHVDPRIPAGVLVVVLLVTILACLPCPKPDNPFDRDPKRLFDASDRAWLAELCGGRCERRIWGVLRCRRPFEQMDHHYPWSHGGATDRRNLVGLCAACNRRKSDRVPTLLSTWCLYRARLRYMPARLRAYAWPRGDAYETTNAADHDG